MSATRKSRRSPRRRKSRRTRSAGRALRWVLAAAVVVVIAGIGLLKWAQSRQGQAALLTLGSPRVYPEVQEALEQALRTVLPGLPTGPATALSDPGYREGEDCDWPDAALGAGAAIRCRTVAVAGDMPWWRLQERIAEAVAAEGGRVLWGERLPDPAAGTRAPDEERDLLRLDVGVRGRPTHTLVLYRAGRKPFLRWGGGRSLTRWETLARDPRPTVALVIDDWGNNTSPPTKALLGLDIPLTMSILPGRPFSRRFSLEATELILPPESAIGARPATAGLDEASVLRRAQGCPVEVVVGRREKAIPVRRREVILHLPMEPQDYPENDPGPGAVMVGMDKNEIAAVLDRDLRGLPQVAGLNNHMGSAATSDPETMHNLMQVLRERGLFFLDSMTTARSVAYDEARKAGVPALRSRLFLDYDQESTERITARLEDLAAAARRGGFAVGIGHPHPATADVLAREIPRLQRAGIRFVTVSELMALQEAAAKGAP